MRVHAALRALMALAALAAVSGCRLTAPATPGPGSRPSASTSLPAPSSTASGAPVALPAVPVPARLVAASSGASGGAGAPGLSGGSGASAQCLAQIESFAELHSGNRVMLGQAAFAHGDQLVLTRMPRRGPDGTPLDGRAAPPQTLVLNLLAGPAGCLVRVAEEPPRSTPLPACTCIAVVR